MISFVEVDTHSLLNTKSTAGKSSIYLLLVKLSSFLGVLAVLGPTNAQEATSFHLPGLVVKHFRVQRTTG